MRLSNIKIPLFFASAKLILHLSTNSHYGFHRDELLYLALGKHLDWGYWSNPPFIGFVSFLNQHILGDGLFATRLVPALFGAALLFLICLMARDLGGGNFAQILAGITGFTSIAYLRSSHMFMPVIIDIFFWSLAALFVIRYLKTENNKWLMWLAVALGIGFLNKYSVAFLIMALAIAFLLTSQRRVYLKKQTWLAVGLALLIVLPNLLWQWEYNFPVIFHMQNLSETQLATVNPFIFLLDQVLMHFFGFLVWIPGLLFLLFNKKMKKYKTVGWIYIATLLLFLVFKGKNYYTLGAYPMLMAAGGVFWEQQLKTKWKQYALAVFIVIGNMPLLPGSLPILPLKQSLAYFDFMANDLGINSLTRWERGNIEALPQDYADMLAWKEIANLTIKATEKTGDPNSCFIYTENYGQAGAVLHFAKYKCMENVVSFADTYRMWAPDEIAPDKKSFIYINDELGGDVEELFSDIELIGEVEHPYARERGTKVYLCRQPKGFRRFWKERAAAVKSMFR
ncbi:MAG TPA: glycosyltransferase family 39 protein [Bacteroidetes bacterium]|nr:glycosyltransferase family 39 protein [Bacteroidota bacterium]